VKRSQSKLSIQEIHLLKVLSYYSGVKHNEALPFPTHNPRFCTRPVHGGKHVAEIMAYPCSTPGKTSVTPPLYFLASAKSLSIFLIFSLFCCLSFTVLVILIHAELSNLSFCA
jgi:hypothetical protein